MSLFNFRRGSAAPASMTSAAVQTESVELIRRRAKHRLIGSVVLVLMGVLGFPLLFDTQPRPVSVDIPIEIPSKNAVKPLAAPAAPVAAPPPAAAAAAVAAPTVAAKAPAAPVLAPPVAPSATPLTGKVGAAASLGEREEIIGDNMPQAPVKPAQPAIKTEAKAAKPEARAEAKPAALPSAASDGARAKALLEGQALGQAPAQTPAQLPTAAAAADAATTDTPASAEGRTIVQVGAYADAAKAKEARAKLEKAGVKTYTQVADTPEGKRIRVRAGPFANRAEAEKAASKIKALDLPAAILTL